MKAKLLAALILSGSALAWAAGDASNSGAKTSAGNVRLPASSGGGGDFFKNEEEGYFWYKDPKEVKVKKKQPLPPKINAGENSQEKMSKQELELSRLRDSLETLEKKQKLQEGPEKMRPGSVAWLRKHIPLALDKAMDTGKKKDMETYLYLVRMALDRADRGSNLQMQVVHSDPFLNEGNRVPIDSFARLIFDRRNKGDIEKGFSYLAKKGGLMFFYDTTCNFCAAQVPLLKKFAGAHGFDVLYVSIDGKYLADAGIPREDSVVDEGKALFKQFNLQLVPSIVYVQPPDKGYVLSQGLITLPTIKDRLLVAIESENLLPPDLASMTHPYKRGLLTYDQMNEAAGIPDDPEKVVEMLKKRISGN